MRRRSDPIRIHLPVPAVLAAVLLVAIGTTPALAELRDSPQAIGSSLPRQGVEYDSALGEMLSRIDESEIYRSTSDLQNIPTRYYPSPGNRRAAEYLHHRLAAIPGLDVAYQSDRYQNVIATLPGKGGTSGEVIIVGAHYDSFSSDPEHAPGATDNACGVGIVVELARVMSTYQFDRTIQFAFWNAEEGEDGQRGSREYVADASEKSLNIPLYFNYDSSGYDPDGRYVLDVISNAESRSFAESLKEYTSFYDIDLALTYNSHTGCGSDHKSFWRSGYPAITTHSQMHAPQAHTQQDTIDLISSGYAKKNAQLGMLVLATTAGIRPIPAITVPPSQPAAMITTPVPGTPPPEYRSQVPSPTVVAPGSPPALGFGKRYAIGDPGSSIGTRFGSGGTPTETGSGAIIPPEPTPKPGDRTHGLTPPAGRFVRWYPAERWDAEVGQILNL